MPFSDATACPAATSIEPGTFPSKIEKLPDLHVLLEKLFNLARRELVFWVSHRVCLKLVCQVERTEEKDVSEKETVVAI